MYISLTYTSRRAEQRKDGCYFIHIARNGEKVPTSHKEKNKQMYLQNVYLK